MRLRDTLPGSVQGLLTHLKRAARSTGRGGQKDCPELGGREVAAPAASFGQPKGHLN